MPRRARLVRFGGRLWLQVLVLAASDDAMIWLWAGGPLHGYDA